MSNPNLKSLFEMENIIQFLFLLLLNVNAKEFINQYIGSSLSIKEANERDLCTNKYCLFDSELLFYAATQNASVDPCVDFKEFSVGTFKKYRAIDDRFGFRGLDLDLDDLRLETIRKLLASKIDEKNDSRVVKIMKNTFGKCVNSSECKFN